MLKQKQKFDSAEINSRTERMRRRIKAQKEWLNSITNDPKEKQRIEKQQCVVCYYTIQICGQGFTKYTCQNCSHDQIWHNTRIPRLCDPCAKKNDLCQNCGADINLKKRILTKLRSNSSRLYI